MKPVWTDEQSAAIVAQRGILSARAIGQQYGVSRNAIIGLWYRARQQDPTIPAMKYGPPRLMPLTTRVDVDLARRLRAEADNRSMSLSHLMATILHAGI